MTHHTQLMSFVMLAVGLLSFAAIYVLSKRTNFGVVSMVALIIGGVLGVIFPGDTAYFAVFGTIYVKTISMMVIPLLLVSLIRSINKMESVQALQSIGSKSFFWLLFQVILAAIVAAVLALSIDLGKGSTLTGAEDYVQKAVPPITQVITDLFSNNLFKSMAAGQVIPVVLFAIMVGIALVAVRTRGRNVTAFIEFIDAAYIVIYQIVKVLIKLLPYAIVPLMANTLATSDASVLKPLLTVIALTFIACFFHIFITGGILIALVAKLNPIKYFKAILPAQIMAFSSRSSAGTLPLYIDCLTKRVGVSDNIAGFVGSLGTSVGMAGCAGVWPVLLAIFALNATTGDVTMTQVIIIIALTPLVSLGTAGVPGGGILIATALFLTMGLPVEVVGIFAGIDAFVDMARTCANVSSSMTAATLVASSEDAITPPKSV
ncbi:dicarboxylate/amino acid:cation symporter [Wohlfahrtiimonas chitiniclastica]|uniref:dicarboxylate/amino acid:cation symporter n=1 Tax=Wohlfahrtiimonas chitiniclastica TaxID=400946 RepID=UPI001BCBBA17|nr:dicarboxylate/amino acid:cation symporter [Wohlfahrtiimonas chitiniclastica]MBS7819888.1 dicarboxylate/amino acid:cation symporter [Wohlfahrtiimonas chitiniclastica]